MTAPDGRQRHREELLAMTQRLIAEYAGSIPAGSVMRTVARCHAEARHERGHRGPAVSEVERAARARLAAIVPAHEGA